MNIYKITNTLNDKTYIGKTTKSTEERWRRHVVNHVDGETHLYRAMRKDGVENFVIETIESTEDLDARERYWISRLSPEYNMTRGGEGGDTSGSQRFKDGVKRHHFNRPRELYATYGMLGKSHPRKSVPLTKNFCPVMAEGVRYESVGAMEKAYYPGARKKLDNPRYPDFYRLKPRTLRKRKLHNDNGLMDGTIPPADD